MNKKQIIKQFHARLIKKMGKDVNKYETVKAELVELVARRDGLNQKINIKTAELAGLTSYVKASENYILSMQGEIDGLSED